MPTSTLSAFYDRCRRCSLCFTVTCESRLWELQRGLTSFFPVHYSAYRQASAHYPSRPVQSDTGGGQHGAAEVPGIRRPHPLHQLAEGWAQSAGERPPHVPAGPGESADQKHQGKWLWANASPAVGNHELPIPNCLCTWLYIFEMFTWVCLGGLTHSVTQQAAGGVGDSSSIT